MGILWGMKRRSFLRGFAATLAIPFVPKALRRELADPTCIPAEGGIVCVMPAVYSVLDYGTAGDGVAYDGDAFTAACRAARRGGGGVVYFPPGPYRIFNA